MSKKTKEDKMKLNLQTVKNARDLGGLTTYDGRRVRLGRLLRTGNMSMLSESDAEILRGYSLKRVLDLRTKAVIDASPNVKLEGVEYIHIPIVKDLVSRVTSKGDYEKRSIGEILLRFTADFEGKGHEWMINFYRDIYSSDYSLSQYKIFLDYLKESTQGATIFHCTAGKDRTGVGAIFLLTLLGVKREQILEDYLRTNESAMLDVAEAQALARERGVDEKIIEDIASVNGVHKEYADAVFAYIDTYPTPEEFFKAKMGIDEEYIRKLRNNYLE